MYLKIIYTLCLTNLFILKYVCYKEGERMLNDRQKEIILALEHSPTPLTALSLADRFHVSLRTMRNDINEIAAFVEAHQASLVRKPHVGMYIESSYSLSIYFDNQYQNDNFGNLESKDRMFLLLMQFVMHDNPITIQKLQDTFVVSRSTIQQCIKRFNRDFASYGIALHGMKKKGICLLGDLSALIRYVCAFMDQKNDRQIVEMLFDSKNELVTKNWKNKIESCIQFLTDHLFLFVTNYHRLIVLLIIIVRANTNTKHQTVMIKNKIASFVDFLSYQFSICLDESSFRALTQVLQLCTDYDDRDANIDENRLIDLSSQLIETVKQEGYVINDESTLQIDLIKHLKSSFNSIQMGYQQSNPLLEQIQQLYKEEFALMKRCVQGMDSLFQSYMNDDEIGYLTLYFKRSFEKAQSIMDTRVMVVCNSGRSASKLLFTRLLNNIPNIHIVAMSSLFELQSNDHALDQIDLVVSTIPLPGVSKPYIVVSPFLQNHEIDQVKEMIWLHATTQYGVSQNREINDMILKRDHLMYESFLTEQALLQSSIGEQYADVCVDLFELLKKLYPMGIQTAKYNNVAGIFVHVLMSISRWKNHDFILANDYEDLIMQHQRQYEAILEFFEQAGKKINVKIPSIEAVAILRYYIF